MRSIRWLSVCGVVVLLSGCASEQSPPAWMSDKSAVPVVEANLPKDGTMVEVSPGTDAEMFKTPTIGVQPPTRPARPPQAQKPRTGAVRPANAAPNVKANRQLTDRAAMPKRLEGKAPARATTVGKPANINKRKTMPKAVAKPIKDVEVAHPAAVGVVAPVTPNDSVAQDTVRIERPAKVVRPIE